MTRLGDSSAALLVLLAASLLAPAANGAGKSAAAADAPIEMHVGVRPLVYIGQPLSELLKKFPAAEVVPFAGQEDASTVNITGTGISCIAVGSPGDLKVASVGFNVDGSDDGAAETKHRTGKGIGKGSTVNDVLEAYGQPVEILGERPSGALRRKVPIEDSSVAKMYQYRSENGEVKTFFLIQNNLVKRIVINELAPLDQHIVKGSSKK